VNVMGRMWVAAVALVLVAGCTGHKPDDGDYVAKMAEARASKDADFQKESDPIPPSRKAEFLPLAYFAIDPAYNVPASLTPSDDQTVIPMPTSTGAVRRMRRAGTLSFALKGQPMTLAALVDLSDQNLNHLFVPFTDLTSGTETYPAGRYLDLYRNGTGLYEIDFNRAYQPYCYYNASYECPYPPAENRLKIPVRAGERMKAHK